MSTIRTISTVLGFLAAWAIPLASQSPDSVAADSTRHRLAPITIGLSAPVRSIGSTRRSVDSTDVQTGARPRTLSELLQARLPGVSVMRLGGDASDGSRVRVRGTVSIVGDASPLVVVDGVPVFAPEQFGSTVNDVSMPRSSRFDDFEPEEIEQIDVLSGPAATTLFGGGASNGAIVITTKRGATGRPQWRAWSQAAVSHEPATYPTLYRQNGVSPATGAATTCTVVEIANNQCSPTTLDVWNPLESASPFRQGRYGVGGASIAGGPYGIKAYASLVGRAETSVLDDSWGSRINGRLNVERELFGGLTVGGSAGYVDRNAKVSADNVVARGLTGFAVDDANHGYQPTFSPPWTFDRDGNRLSRSVRLNWRALSWLRLNGVAGRDELKQTDYFRFPSITGTGSSQNLARAWQASSIIHGTAEAVHRPWARVAMRTLVSYEESDRRAASEAYTTSIIDGTQYRSVWQLMGYSIRSWMVQERLELGDRIFVNAGARRIAGERSGNRGRWHPSIDAAWDVGQIASNATLRVRAAYAVGIQPRDTSSVFFFVTAAPFDPNPPAPIEPEEPREAEIGAEARWGSRVELSASYFDQRTPKLITLGPLPPSLGFTTVGAFLSEIRNRGVELVARVALVDRPTTRWTAAVTLATLRNRMGDVLSPAATSGPTTMDGEPFGTFYGRRYTFVDANGDGVPVPSEVTASDWGASGTAIPTREASLRSDLGLRRWGLTLSAALDHRAGHRAYNVIDYVPCFYRTCRGWQDPSAPLSEKVKAVAGSVIQPNSIYLEDASYTRLGELAIAWTPPPRFGRVLSSGLTLSIEARNVATWTSFGGADPEVATTTSARLGSIGVPMLPAVPRTIGVRVEVR